jgi:hypothetical protein
MDWFPVKMKLNLRHRFLLLVGAATGGFVPGELSAGTASPSPNILLVLSDDHSAPHVGCYSNREIKTPNLDRFA